MRGGQINYILGQESILYLLHIWLSQRCWQFLEAAFNLNYHITLLSSPLFLLLTFNKNIFWDPILFKFYHLLQFPATNSHCNWKYQEKLWDYFSTNAYHGRRVVWLRYQQRSSLGQRAERHPIRNSEEREAEWRDEIQGQLDEYLGP